jgi:hypothetical protein
VRLEGRGELVIEPHQFLPAERGVQVRWPEVASADISRP